MQANSNLTWGKSLFFIIVAFSASAMALYKLDLANDNWQDWIIVIGLEALRAALVLSNIGIRNIDLKLSYGALGLSVIATIGLGVMSHFHVAETMTVEGVTSSVNPIATDDWWMLQTINLLLLFCEWSMSVLIAGHLMNWEAWAKWIETDFDSHFDQSTYEDSLEIPLKRVVERVRKFVEWTSELRKELGVEGKKLEDLQKFLSDHLEKAKTASKKAKEQAARIEVLESETSSIRILERYMRGEIAEGEIPQQIIGMARYLAIGLRVQDKRLSIGNNQYEVHCSGQAHVPTICPPFNLKKSEKTKACPNCGKVYSVN